MNNKEEITKIVFPNLEEIRAMNVHDLAVLKAKVHLLEEIISRQIRAKIQR